METRGPKLNSSELLCLSWLPATFMVIRSKMNELAWRHHFPIITLSEIFQTTRAANSVVSGLIWPKFILIRDFIHVLITCKYKKDRIKKQPRKGRDIIFPIISQWGASAAMETSVLSQSPQDLMQPFPHPYDATHKIWSRLANWLQGSSSSKVWNFCHKGK